MDEKAAALARLGRSADKATHWADRKAQDAKAAYEAGASVSEVARAMGANNPEPVRRYLIRLGVEMRPQHKHHGGGQQ